MDSDAPHGRSGGAAHDLPVDPDVEVAERLTVPRGLAAQLREVVRARWDVLLSVAVGGGLGATARYAVSRLVPYELGAFPTGTFLVNATGCLAIGTLMVVLAAAAPGSRLLRPLLGVGVLGGYTTFSTYALESRDLVAGGHPGTAGLYVVASLVVGLVAVSLGMLAGSLITGRARRGGTPA